jgi:type 2 lantibiotic biosynthesis protein LanM
MALGTADVREIAEIDRVVGWLVEPALARLAAELDAVASLRPVEREVVRASTASVLRETAWRRLSRVVVLELQAARRAGLLTGPDSRTRWEQWAQVAATAAFWQARKGRYPDLLPRLRLVVDNRCRAALLMARRFGADRAALARLTGASPGVLTEVEFGAGDSHERGQAVAVLRCEAGRLVYKPRPLAVDAALAGLLPRFLPREPATTRIRVPAVIVGNDHDGEYGWAEHVPHRYCRGEEELLAFYRGLGHWLAVMRLLGGSDLHSENVIACGPVPVVIDCETLFTPYHRVSPTGYGAAVDRANDLLNGSVLRTGLLPARVTALGWRGVDASAVGALPGQQPAVRVPVIADHATDQARVETTLVPPDPSANHPSPSPDLGRYWPTVIDGFIELTQRLRGLDRACQLAPMLKVFADCRVRVVLRDTAAYGELGRMLWHPRALHRPQQAREQAARLLARHGEMSTAAPDDPAVIDAEVADLCEGDVPFFSTTTSTGELTGPRGTRWGQPQDLVGAALRHWRASELDTDRRTIHAALVGAYLNEGWLPDITRMVQPRLRVDDLDRRRRALAASVVRQLGEHALWGDDGTVTWVAPGLGLAGWGVQPLSADLYSGTMGVAVLLAGYLREVAAGRADPVTGTHELLTGLLRTIRCGDEQAAQDRAAAAEAAIEVRPDPPGSYIGLSSRIWGWLLLGQLAAVPHAEAGGRTEALAAGIRDAVAADEAHDLLVGAAGVLVPLLRLAERSGDRRWVDFALEAAMRVGAAGEVTGAGTRWTNGPFPEGVGGFAHGSIGIGWALRRLALATASTDVAAYADAALAFTESLYEPTSGGWRELRTSGNIVAATWCHGPVGIGICASDLLAHSVSEPARQQLRDLLRRAALDTWPERGFGWNHTLCHGDLGSWELLAGAEAAGVAPSGYDPEALAAQIIGSIEKYGPTTSLARQAFEPGLVVGMGGVAYQLLRMHPDSDLPSVLLPDPGPAR